MYGVCFSTVRRWKNPNYFLRPINDWIENVIYHPDLDLAIIILKEPVNAPNIQIGPSVFKGKDVIITRYSQNINSRLEVVNDSIDKLSSTIITNEYESPVIPESIIDINGPINKPPTKAGDSGMPIFDYDGNSLFLIGIMVVYDNISCPNSLWAICTRNSKVSKSLYLNLTNPGIRKWIVENTEG